MKTLLLSRDDIEQLLDPIAALAGLRAGFQAYSSGGAAKAQRVRADLRGPGTVTVLFPGSVPGVPAYSVKVHAKFPGETPAIKGVLLLHDSRNGDLLAVMDSTYLTAVRTGLTSALATDLLAKDDARSVAIIGAGVQGEFQLRFLNQVRKLENVRVFDTMEDKASCYCERMALELNVDVHPVESLEAAVIDADVILAATWAREPILYPNMVPDGVHITTLGSDEPGKCEVSPALIRAGMFICDDRDLAVQMGAIGGAGLTVEDIDGELGQVIAGIHPGRQDGKEITIFGSVGIAFQDLVVAWQIYREAVKREMGESYAFINRVPGN